jgi:hypothetical protein
MRRAALLVFVLAIVGGLAAGTSATGFRVSRLRTVDVYVTAVKAGQSDIGYVRSPAGPAVGTYELRALTEWADGAHARWPLVGRGAEGGRPTCIREGSYGAHVELHVLTAVAGMESGTSITSCACAVSPNLLQSRTRSHATRLWRGSGIDPRRNTGLQQRRQEVHQMGRHEGGVGEGPVWKPEAAYAQCICGWSELHDTAREAHMAIDAHLTKVGAA